MDHEAIFISLRELDGVITYEIIDENGDILKCYVPERFDKKNLSKMYAIEANILRNLEALFGGFKYRIAVFKERGKTISQIIYKWGEYYIVASSKKRPEIFLNQIENILGDIKT